MLLEFREISRVSEAITAKRMKIDPYCQRLNCTVCLQLLEFKNPLGNPGNLPEFVWSSWKFV